MSNERIFYLRTLTCYVTILYLVLCSLNVLLIIINERKDFIRKFFIEVTIILNSCFQIYRGNVYENNILLIRSLLTMARVIKVKI